MNEALLEAAWFAAEGLPYEVNTTIHPSDEMARLDLLKTDAARRRMLYMRTGHEALLVLKNMLRAAGRPMSATPSALDFACGYGRVLRFLTQEIPADRITASDIVRSAVDFVQATLGVSGVYSATDTRALQFDKRFSLITAFSLFSHLPLPRFKEFLRMLYELLEPDGLLFFSTHGPFAIAPERRDPSGFTYRMESGIPHLDVAEYGSTFVEPRVVRELCSDLGIQHLWSLDRELWRIQDVYVAARRDVPGLQRWSRTSIARGWILRADISAAGVARAEGYVRTPAHSTASALSIVVDGARTFPCLSRPHPLPLPDSEGGMHFRQTDWYVEGPSEELLSGSHTIAGVAELDDGTRNCFDVTWLRRTSSDDHDEDHG
jgi:SAM-dependent methyltransferase